MASTYEAFLWQQIGFLDNNTAQAISTQTLVSPAATVSFPSIPQTYTHLMLICSAKSASTATSYISDNIYLQFNGVTSANYNLTGVYNTQASAVSSAFASSKNYLELGALWTSYSSNTAGAGGSWTMIPNYTSTSFAKSALQMSYASDGGGFADFHVVGGALAASTSTAAITSIVVGTVSGSNFVANSTFELIGVP